MRSVIDTRPFTPDPREFDHETVQVAALHHKFGFIRGDRPVQLTARKRLERLECLREELEEFATANACNDYAGMADALVDLVVFAKGTAVMMGLPWAALFDDVMRANMAKVRGVGHRGHKVDLVKPEGWRGPRTIEILNEHGYNPNDEQVDDEPT